MESDNMFSSNTAPRSGERYFCEDLDAIPFGRMVALLANTVPKPIAFGLMAYFRVRKWIGRSPLPAYGFGPIGSSHQLAREDMPARAMSRFAARLEQLSDLGFSPLKFSVSDHIGAKEAATVLLIDTAATTFATLEWFQMPRAGGIQERNLLELNSILATPEISQSTDVNSRHEIREVMTALASVEDLPLQDIVTLEDIDTVFLPDTLSPQKAMANHTTRLASRQMRIISDPISEYQRLSQRRFDAMLARGLLRELSHDEIDKIREFRLQR
jgi:hypothetical protein